MVLNHDQRIASRIAIKRILAVGITDPDVLNRAMDRVDDLYGKYPIRTEIYMELKRILECEFDIDPFVFYFVILKDIYELYRTGLNHLDVFIEIELDNKKPQSFMISGAVNDAGQ